MKHDREYNLRASIYLARNRLTHWVNRNTLTSRPEKENLELFVPYKLMRNMEYHEQAVIDMCKKVKVPTIWQHTTFLF